jgi:serine/threonine-protein kinase RsbW
MTTALPPQPGSVTRARNILNTLLSLTDVTDQDRGDLAMLITEACTNAVKHATAGTVDITITIDDHSCEVTVGNHGSKPNGGILPAELPDPLTVGGRGLPLITALADTAAFIPAPPGQVLLRMTKQLSPPPAQRTPDRTSTALSRGTPNCQHSGLDGSGERPANPTATGFPRADQA